jgi:hypothetical protein
MIILFLITVIGGCTDMSQVKRYGMVIGIKEEKIEKYKKLQANVGPDRLRMIKG